MKRYAVWICLGLVCLGLGTVAVVYLFGKTVDKNQLRVHKTFPIGGEGKYDHLCLDVETRRLYLPRSNTVQVVDLDKGVLVETIANVSNTQAHDVALVPERKLGFVSAGKDNCVCVFNLETLKITTTIRTGANPDGILYDPASKHVFSINNMGGDVTVIDPAALDNTLTIPVGGKLEAGVVDGAGHLFICVEDTNEIVQIDTKANTALARWPLGTGKAPTSVAIDPEHTRLFVGCGNSEMVILNAKTGDILGKATIGRGVDGVAYEPVLGIAVSANGKDATLSVVKETEPGKFDTIQTLSTYAGARTITIDPSTHQILLVCNLPEGSSKTFGVVVVGPEVAKE